MIDADREIELNSLVREVRASQKNSWNSISCTRNMRSPSKYLIQNALPKNRFADAFNHGDRASFFELWDATFSDSIRNSDPTFQKLEFTLSIYFAIFPIHKFVSSSAQQLHTLDDTMATLKSYLGSRGSELCKTTQFLSFYALPYVPDPMQHPSFKDLFRQEWIHEIKERLLIFLDGALRRKDSPKLLRLLDSKNVRVLQDYQNLTKQNRDLRMQLQEEEDKEHTYSAKHRNLQGDYHNLIMIASELVQTLASCINGEQITPLYLVSICHRLAAFKKQGKSIDSLNKAFAGQPVEQEADIVKRGNNSVPHIKESLSHAGLLDYKAIGNDLELWTKKQIDSKTILLLEALASGSDKANLIEEYVVGDILTLGSGSTGYLENILNSSSSSAKHQLVRLINLMSDYSIGRAYILCQQAYPEQSSHSDKRRRKAAQSFVHTMANALIEEGGVDSAYKQNLLGILQKLSVRRFAQTLLIRYNIIPHLHDLLENIYSNKLSEYTIEYGVSLLMNLSLRSMGRQACLESSGNGNGAPKHRTLQLLMDMIGYDNEHVKTYVVSMLYNLLLNADLRAQSQEIGLLKVLKKIQEGLNEKDSRQVEYIVQLLAKEDVGQEEEDSEDGEEDDSIDVEGDEYEVESSDSQDTLAAKSREVSGQKLLESYAKKRKSDMKLDRRTTSVRSSMSSVSDINEMRRARTPTLVTEPNRGQPHIAPAAGTFVGDSDSERDDVALLPKTRKANVPSTVAEIADFDLGFTTKPRIARTPLTQSLTAVPGEFEAIRKGKYVRSSLSSSGRIREAARKSKNNHHA